MVDLDEPDTGTATPGTVIAWQQATQSIPNAPTLGALSVDLAGTWEEAYNLAIGLPDVHRAPWLRKVARKVIYAHNTRTKPEGAAGTAAQPGESDAVGAGRSPDNAGSVSEGGAAQPELAGRGSAAPEPDIVIGAKDASNVAITTRKKRQVAPPAEPQVQQGLGEDVAATNPTTEQTLRDTIASLLGKGHNWYNQRPHWLDKAHKALDAAVAAAYGWDDYSPEMPGEEILGRLLALNLERAG